MIHDTVTMQNLDIPEYLRDGSFAFDYPEYLISNAKAFESSLQSLNEKIRDSKKLFPSVQELDCPSIESEPLSEEESRPCRILMLHGFTQSGDFFSSKTRKLRERITESLQEELGLYYPDGIEFLYPDGLHHLCAADIPEHGAEAAGEDGLYGWFNINEQPFRGLEESLVWLADYIRSVGPIDGVIGFSQGGALAMMLAALCEGESNAARLEALAQQPLSIRIEPPQAAFKFAVSFSGFRGATNHYDGFYNPTITTPALCVVADLDTMVPAELGVKLIDSCQNAEVIHHRGGHFVPSDNRNVNAVAKFVHDRIVDGLW